LTVELVVPKAETEATTLNRIRVETALSRYPIHRLARKGNVTIDLQNEQEIKWEVTYNAKHGQPGPLAYKLDTLIVNRRIDEAPRPLPEYLKLGSLREICRELGLADHDNEPVKKAFHQNASAYITAKIRYKTKTGRERWAEIGYSRYAVVFTGDLLPDGAIADAVYIVINAAHRDLLNQVEVRPLDYDYLMRLAPGPQRFYELVSFQVYGAIANGRPRAKMLYSDYCKYAPQVRYLDFEHVKKQMYKVHIQHRESGYITKVEYQETKDNEGRVDWEMYYTPGPKAEMEYRTFTTRNNRAQQASAAESRPAVFVPKQQLLSQHNSCPDAPLLTELLHRGIAESKARSLLSNLKPGQNVMAQLQHVDLLLAGSPRGKYRNPAGLYVRFLEENVLVPETSRTGQGTASRQVEYDEYCHQEIERCIAQSKEYRAILERQRQETKTSFPTMSPTQVEQLAHHAACAEMKASGRVKLPSFDQFLQMRRV
jgi:hypothetical protein